MLIQGYKVNNLQSKDLNTGNLVPESIVLNPIIHCLSITFVVVFCCFVLFSFVFWLKNNRANKTL